MFGDGHERRTRRRDVVWGRRALNPTVRTTSGRECGTTAVTGSRQSAIIGIETMQILEGQLPARVYGLVAGWGVRQRALLRENWRRAIAREPLLSIPPLE